MPREHRLHMSVRDRAAIGDARHMAREPINPGPDVVPEKQPPDIPSPAPICRTLLSRIRTYLRRIRLLAQTCDRPVALQYFQSEFLRIAVRLLGALSLLSLQLNSPFASAMQTQAMEQECLEIARAAMSGALRVVGDSSYLINREILRQLGCRRIPGIKRQICSELTQKASNIGTQGIPGYRNIRDLMKDMGC